ncbi:MAG: hypothetical protein KKB82_07505 [Candidatus Omnitrophica bacterium]|nr:hypothetical protein [Candidatus Omnitrophota bacterium]
MRIKIAGVIVQAQSDIAFTKIIKQAQESCFLTHFDKLIYKGRQKSSVSIIIKRVNKLPQICNAKQVFIMNKSWCLLEKGNKYIYRIMLENSNNEQVIIANRTFTIITAYVLSVKDKRCLIENISSICNFLQVLLARNFAKKRCGVLVHAAGIKRQNGKGFVFAGKSGAGKSTMSDFWSKQNKTVVLNDERIIIRKIKNRFFIFGSPFQRGNFCDILSLKIETVCLGSIFFIYHASKNKIKKLSEKEAFMWIFPVLFPVFWDKDCLKNIVLFCQDLIKKVPCYRLGFVNNKSVVGFVKKYDKRHNR